MVNMANKNNGKNGGEISVNLGKSLSEKLTEYASDKDKSVNAVVKTSVEQYLDECSTKEIIRSECRSDENPDGGLREDSRVCKALAREEEK